MRLNDSILSRFVPVLLFVSGLDIVYAQSPLSDGRAIEFSVPKNGGTNLFKQFFQNDNAADAMGDDQFQAPQSILPAGSPNGVVLPPRSTQPTAVQSKQLKTLMEKRAYWFLDDPNGKPAGTTPEEIFHLRKMDASGRPMEEQSPVEKYLQRQAANGQTTDKAKKDSQMKEEGNTVYGIRRLLDTSSGGFDLRDSALSPGVPGIFAPQNGFGYPNQASGAMGYNPTPTPAATTQKAMMDEFNKAIGLTEADNPKISPLASPLNSSSPNAIGSDWNPFLNSAKAALPKKSEPAMPAASALISGIGVVAPKPVIPVVTQPAKVSVVEQYQPLFAPDISMPRRRVQ